MSPALVASLAPVAPGVRTVSEYMATLADGSRGTGCAYGCERGQVWLRVYRQDSATSRSAIAFVRLADGAVYRADSWRKPGRALGYALEVV